jgi:hypothetical protein
MEQMVRKQTTPNPHGREGKPFSLYPHTFDEVVEKMLNTPPPPKPQSKTEKKPAKKVSRKK